MRISVIFMRRPLWPHIVRGPFPAAHVRRGRVGLACLLVYAALVSAVVNKAVTLVKTLLMLQITNEAI